MWSEEPLTTGFCRADDLGTVPTQSLADPGWAQVRSDGVSVGCRCACVDAHDDAVRSLVGRGREVAVLEGAVTDALSGMGGVAGISGEPGIGKTTLVRAVGSSVVARGVPVLWGRATEAAPVYWPWREVLRARADAVGDAVLRDELGPGRSDLVRVAPELGARLAVEPALGDGGRPWLFDAFERWLGTAARRDGLVVILEDLHWADLDSVRVLEHLAAGLAASRALVLVTYRSTERGGGVVADLDAVATVTRVELSGLSVGAVREVLESTSARTVDTTVSARVRTLTGGNPLFVSELGRLLGDDMAAGEPIDHMWPREVPETVRALIRRRLERLAPQTQAVLHAAAVVGPQYPVAVVAAMVHAPAIECVAALDAAHAAGLVEDSELAGSQRFVHALIRDAVIGDLPTAERVRLHRAAADALEAAVDRVVQPAAVAAHLAAAVWTASADEGGHHDRLHAARWASRAADEAMHRLAWDEAVRLRREALDLGGPTLDDGERCELVLRLARALARSGALADSLAACHEAADLSRATGRTDHLVDAALVLQGVGDVALSPALQRLAEDALQALGDGQPGIRARLLAQLAEARLYQHDEYGVDVHSRDALAHADVAGDRDTLLVALRARRLATMSPDRLDETLDLADRVLDLVRRPAADAARHAFWAHVWRIQVWFVRGRLDLITDELHRLAAAADGLGEPLATAQLFRFRAMLASARGSFADAVHMAERANAIMRRTGQMVTSGQDAGFRVSIGRFVGYPDDLADALALPPEAAGPFVSLGRVRSALVLAGMGRTSDAAVEYRRLDPVASWPLPGNLQLTAWALRLRTAVALAIRPDIEALIELLTPHRGLHAGGGISCDGPIELAIATGAAVLGDLDAAAGDLASALHWARAHGARAFLVETMVELAGVLARRAGPGDVEHAETLLDEADATATELGMTPFAARARRLSGSVGRHRSRRSQLTAREIQVAHLVARGLTNRQIADTLVVSERTAENHVQHILTKLGFANRVQIAAWVATRPATGLE